MIERIEKIYTIEEVFAFITENYDSTDKQKRINFDGDMIKVFSIRYETFMQKGTTCVCCGMKSSRFYKERHQENNHKNYNPNIPYHFNLYGVNENGEEILFTKNHILAHALGGSDDISNMQTMCSSCNRLKSHMTIDERENTITPHTYEHTLELANKYGKSVFVVMSLNNRYFIANSIEDARKKFNRHKVISYEEFNNNKRCGLSTFTNIQTILVGTLILFMI